MKMRHDSTKYVPAAVFVILLLFYQHIFGQFFPNRVGGLGHDYSITLPSLLDGYFWYLQNGFFSAPWFTPSFCGGEPFYADAIYAYFALPQFLTLFTDPMRACYLTILVFASIGFWGFYLLLSRVFRASMPASILGAALFMFNGFFAHRAIIGHFGFHAFPLLPLVAYFLMRPVPDGDGGRSGRNLRIALDGVLAGLVLAYLPQSGMLPLLIPFCLALAVLACIGLGRGASARLFLLRAGLGAAVFTGLSLAKVVAGLALLSHMERSDYPLPGIPNPWNALSFLFQILFLSPVDIAQTGARIFTNVKWYLERHEYEFGLTVAPLLVFLAAGYGAVRARISGAGERRGPAVRAVAYYLLALLLLLVPLVVNLYSPWWNALLKSLPVIRSSSSLERWFLVYVPFVCLAAALALDSRHAFPRWKSVLAGACIALMVVLNLTKDRAFYHDQGYSAGEIIRAYQAARSGKKPEIKNIGVFVNAQGQVVMPLDRNNLIAAGASQLACYNPVFGYGLEHLPIGTLHAGPILDETDGHLNLKNPACYVYPEENQCRPGDHFPVARKADAEAFAKYRPFPFAVSSRQAAANVVSEATVIVVALFLGLAAYNRFRPFRGRTGVKKVSSRQ